MENFPCKAKWGNPFVELGAAYAEVELGRVQESLVGVYVTA